MSNITKTAMITVCGRPNVGKSSLTNALVGEKVAIVSNKAQTTRNRIYGIVNREDTQYILLDTPGLHKPKSALGDYMVKVVTSSLSDVDCALLLVEPIPHVGGPEKALIDRIREEKIPCILCINKIDTVEPAELLPVIAAYNEVWDGFDAIIPISAHKGGGLDDLMHELQKYAQEGPQLFPDGETTDQPERQVMGELLREKLAAYAEKGQVGRTVRVMVLGIPNVGKSTFINKVAKRKTAKAEDRPGVTRSKQWVPVDATLELLDTPGILWPKFDDTEVGKRLAFTGAIKDDVLDIEELACYLMEYLAAHYADVLRERYKVDIDEGDSGYDLLEKAGRKRGFLMRGAQVDTERMARILLDEFRGGKLGRFTLETVEECGG